MISAKVHTDEKTPHMHFLHVPVTPDGRLNANKIYTRESLKKLQTELPAYLQSRGFDLQRGIEQKPGAAKKHLNTREFKQQQEALHSLERQAQSVSAELEQRQREEAALRERLQSFERQAQEAEKTLSKQSEIPKASMLNYKSALETAQEIIERQKKALADRAILTAKNEKQQEEIHSLRETVTNLNEKYSRSESERQQEQERSTAKLIEQMKTNNHLVARLEKVEAFFRWNTTAGMMRDEYERDKQQEAQKKAAEERQRKWEAEQQERQRQAEKERQAKELEQQKALELERQREEREVAKAHSLEKKRGRGLSR